MAARRPIATWFSTRFRTPRWSSRASACPFRARSAGRSSATRSSAFCARPSPRRSRPSLPGHDVVVVARPEALELAEREGLAGVEAALGELLAKSGLQPAGPDGRAGGATDERRRTRRASARHRPGRAAQRSPWRRCFSTAASSRRRSPGAASTSPPARITRSTRSGSTAYLRALCSPGGGCSGATHGATADTIPSRPSESSGPMPNPATEARGGQPPRRGAAAAPRPPPAETRTPKPHAR